MAGDKGKKRAISYDSDGPEETKGSGGNDWSAWQEGVRSQEADRVQQYVKTFQADIVQKAHDAALADLRRREAARAQRSKKMHARILEECNLEDTETDGHPLYIAGQQVLDLLETMLAQYHQTNDAQSAINSKKGKDDFKRIRSSWDNDLTEAHTLLGYGRAYGDGLVRDIIVPDANATVNTTDSGLNKTGKAALGMFPRSSTTVASRDTWGEAAQSQMDVLSRLMKTMSGGPSVNKNEYSVQAPEKKTVRFEI